MARFRGFGRVAATKKIPDLVFPTNDYVGGGGGGGGWIFIYLFFPPLSLPSSLQVRLCL